MGKKTSVLLDITYRCNSHCKFCCNLGIIEDSYKTKHQGEMTLQEIEENLDYIQEKYDVTNIIISGGEPAMHRRFWEVMDTIYSKTNENVCLSIETNALLFNHPEFCSRFNQMLEKHPNRNLWIEISLTTIVNPENPNSFEQKKLAGIEKIAEIAKQHNIVLNFFLFATKSNYKNLPVVAQKTLDICEKNDFRNANFTIGNLSVRGLANAQEMAPEINEELIMYLTHAVQIVKNVKWANLSLSNFPLCFMSKYYYPDDLKKLATMNFNDDRFQIKINKYCQKEDVDSHDDWVFKTNWKENPVLSKVCKDCCVEEFCTKIQGVYIEDKGKNYLKKIQENIEKLEKADSVEFPITYVCNLSCKFCCADSQIQHAKTQKDKGIMSYNEVYDNLLFVKGKIKTNEIVISGGEPSTHPEFWSIMEVMYNRFGDLFNITFDTNGITFIDEDKQRRLKQLLSNCRASNRYVEVTLTSVNDLSSQRYHNYFKGILNVIETCLSTGTPLSVVVYYTKDNYRTVPQLIEKILEHKKQYKDSKLKIELGLVTLLFNPDNFYEVLPDKFKDMYPFIEKSLTSLSEQNIPLFLANIPYCILKNVDFKKITALNQAIDYERVLAGVNKYKQYGNIRYFDKWTKKIEWKSDPFLSKSCNICRYEQYCNKIDSKYIEIKYIEKVKPFK